MVSGPTRGPARIAAPCSKPDVWVREPSATTMSSGSRRLLGGGSSRLAADADVASRSSSSRQSVVSANARRVPASGRVSPASAS